ncbi:MAG: hypothetical protein P4L50_26975 [Anaerolineaceae bacterium]|nr:hypothetical protein [Anaerolineaceae bacterium]
MDPENPPQPGQPEAEKPSESSVEGGSPRPESQAAPSEAEAAPQPHPGIFKRFGHFLFNPETNLGRNMRGCLRAFVYGLVMFALGMLFYFILVRPELDELDIARNTLKSNQQQISSLQATLTANQGQLGAVQTSLQKSQAELQKAQLGASLVVMLNQIDTASMAVLNKDGPTVQRSLADARISLNNLLPAIRVIDPSVATQLDARLTLVSSELVDDPATTQSDLALLRTALVNFDKELSGIQ